ncbi:flippase [uncultured Pontibacter sp.]|uniref:flippase n=1 Tax=uncultured Pontibacter sp. TaxID=453356 RepID=UPI0026246E4D|nr:flippase [uncultured Pontibacter sp.]
MKPSIFSRLSNKLADENKPLLANFFSLGLIQVINFLLSIITFPYIVRVVGIEYFGLITVAQAVMLYLNVFTDYGFNLTATKDISVNRDNKTYLSTVFSEVIVTKAVLFLVSGIVLLLAFSFVPQIQVYSTLIMLSLPIVLGQLLQPLWFFQGMEQMKYITYINITTRALYAICIFAFINEADDYLYINFINGITAIIGGVLSFVIVFRTFGLKFKLPRFTQLTRQLKDGWSIFISTITVTIANNTNILILSLFATPLVLGYYSIAEKVFLITRTFAVILHQVVYPRICLLAQQPFKILAVFLNKILKLILLTFLPLGIGVFVFADYIVFLIAGEYHSVASTVLRIVCFAPLMAALNIPVAQTMLAFRLNRTFATIVSIGAAANIGLNLVLASQFKAIGTAWSILLTEMLITILLYVVFYKQYPQYSFFSLSRSGSQEQVKQKH